MARVIVETNDGHQVLCFPIDPSLSGSARGRLLTGRNEPILGILAGAIDDALLMDKGVDPRRLSELVMDRLAGKE